MSKVITTLEYHSLKLQSLLAYSSLIPTIMIDISSTCSETCIDTDSKTIESLFRDYLIYSRYKTHAIVAILVVMCAYNSKWGTMAIGGKNTIFDNVISW